MVTQDCSSLAGVHGESGWLGGAGSAAPEREPKVPRYVSELASGLGPGRELPPQSVATCVALAKESVEWPSVFLR